jgi:hypothetical protein
MDVVVPTCLDTLLDAITDAPTILELYDQQTIVQGPNLSFTFGAAVFTPLHCTGSLLLCSWTLEPEKEPIARHVHGGILQVLGVSSGSILIKLENTAYVLNTPKSTFTIPCGKQHTIQVLGDTPVTGWSLFIPPETGFIPKHEGCCLLPSVGRCGSKESGEECTLLQQVQEH